MYEFLLELFLELSRDNHTEDYANSIVQWKPCEGLCKSTIYAFLKISHHWNYINYLFDKWHDQHLKQKRHVSKFMHYAKNTNVSPIIFNTFYYKQYDVNIYVNKHGKVFPI